MKNIISIITICLMVGSLTAKEYSVSDLFAKAIEYHPIAKDYALQEAVLKSKLKNNSTNYYPNISLNGSAIYNSEVVDFSNVTKNLPPQLNLSFPNMPNEQYKVALSLNQTIWDGGATYNLNKFDEIDNKINQQSIAIEIEQVKYQINDIFYNIIILNKQRELLTLFNEMISERKSSLEVAVQAGAAMQMNVDILEAELIKNKQTLDEIELSNIALLENLSQLTGVSISQNDTLKMQDYSIDRSLQVKRNELNLFSLQKEKLDVSSKLAYTSLMPKAIFFAEGGWGKPAGMNFFSDDFSPYINFGASLKWNFFDWFKTKRNVEISELSKKTIENKSKYFEKNILLNANLILAEIEKLEKSLVADARIIIIRKEVTATVEIRLNAGVITATEFLTEFNQEKQARINLETHLIQLEQNKAKYLLILGIL